MSSLEDLNHHQNKALRLLRLLELLQQKAWRPHELRQELNLGERAIFDYLGEARELAQRLGLPFAHDRARGTYQIEVVERLGTIETLVTHAALRMLAHHSPGYNSAYQEALRKLARHLPAPLRQIALRSTQALQERPPSFNGLNLERMAQAWLERRVVAFDYRIPQGREIRVELEVYFIEVSRANMAVYVIGRDLLYGKAIHYRDNLKTYKLDRIDRVQLRDTGYTIPDDFDPSEYLSTAWGIVTSENPVRVRLRFAPEAAHRIREGNYPNLQELGQLEAHSTDADTAQATSGDNASYPVTNEQHEGSYTLVEITVGADSDGFPLELLPWIQSWGPRVEVLEPQSLRERWLEEAQAVVDLYKPKGSDNRQAPKQYWAHTHKDRSRWQSMQEHTSEVARLASEKAACFGESEKARLAGLLHDLGKYGDLFQRRLEGKESGLDHWSAGAHIALKEYRAVEVALAIQGHHIGLQSGAMQSLQELLDLAALNQKHPLDLRLSETNTELLKQRLVADLGSLPPSIQPVSKKFSAAEMLDTRMLFSCLVDADFLDTERTMNQGKPRFVPRPRPPELQAARALERLEARLEELGADPNIPQKTRSLRRDLADACAQAAHHPARAFTLTAPTGSGKTLAMLRFALGRAVHDPRVRRIVVVLPFLTILDQTVDIYRALFAGLGEHYILEHHSLTGLRGGEKVDDAVAQSEKEKRLLSENWDAPIIITTSVQLLESLHAGRPGACRKLHNLAGSIVLFDEVQTLPTKLAVPTLKTLARLASEKYHCTVLFSTATQPAFDLLNDVVRKGEPETSSWQPREIVSSQQELFSRAKRVHTVWSTQTPLAWPDLVAQLTRHPQALCIVNLKRHAYALTQEAQTQNLGGIYHLSTALCPQHRRDLLAQIVEDLKANKPCRVFATQCVEAGVDLDFPVVYRALAPLDAIAQARGRCNRHDAYTEPGSLTVFVPEEEKYPTRAYEQAASLTKSLLVEHGSLDLDDPGTYRRFYRGLYSIANTTQPELEGFITSQNYQEFARRYRLIETNAVNVVVPYNDDARTLMQEARDQGISGDWIRRVRGYTVPHFLDKTGTPPYLEPLFLRYQRGLRTEVPDWFLCGDQSLYHRLLGFTPEEGGAQGALVL
jgi:CRISPR-associated helicase Cas3/CRISPR-associated endonuclease Cas3-HD